MKKRIKLLNAANRVLKSITAVEKLREFNLHFESSYVTIGFRTSEFHWNTIEPICKSLVDFPWAIRSENNELKIDIYL